MGELLLLSVLAGLATCLGSVLVLLSGEPGRKSLSLFLGLAAGIMLGVVILDLIPSALALGSVNKALFGFWLGVILTYGCDITLSALLKNQSTGQGTARYLQMGILIALGIAFHDLPEGIAIAAGYSAQVKLGIFIALAIGLHNIPEGMATTAPLHMGGLAPSKILLLASLLSLVTPLGTLIGFYLIHLSKMLIPLLLALAAGTMSYLVISEIFPESHRQGRFRSLGGVVIGLGIILTVKLLEM